MVWYSIQWDPVSLHFISLAIKWEIHGVSFKLGFCFLIWLFYEKTIWPQKKKNCFATLYLTFTYNRETYSLGTHNSVIWPLFTWKFICTAQAGYDQIHYYTLPLKSFKKENNVCDMLKPRKASGLRLKSFLYLLELFPAQGSQSQRFYYQWHNLAVNLPHCLLCLFHSFVFLLLICFSILLSVQSITFITTALFSSVSHLLVFYVWFICQDLDVPE